MASQRFIEDYIKHTASEKKQFEEMESSYNTILKDLIILAGTVFTTSIALAAGRDVNGYFVSGELLLLISIVAGLILMYYEQKRRLKTHVMYLKNDFQDFLELKKGKLDNQEKLFIDQEIQLLNKQFRHNGILDNLLRLIPVSILPKLFFIFLFLGIVVIWYSLMG